MSYSSNNLKMLTEKEAVRLRPNMYLGTTDVRGLHHLVSEILDNACDEALNGHANEIFVHLHDDDETIEIRDNGRGIPVDKNTETGMRGIEMVFLKFHAGGKFDRNNYDASGGLHGVGASVVNYLSEYLTATVYGKEVITTFKTVDGDVTEITDRARAKGDDPKGTSVTFKPLFRIFNHPKLEYDRIRTALKNKAHILAGVKFVFRYKGKDEVFYFKDGLKALFPEICTQEGVLLDRVIDTTLDLEKTQDNLTLQMILTYARARDMRCASFVNMIPTYEGGSHENGMLLGLLQALRQYDEILQGKKSPLQQEDIKGGLRCVMSLTIRGEISFEGNLKAKLYAPEYQGSIQKIVHRSLEQFLTSNPTRAKTLLDYVYENRQLRLHQKKQEVITTKKKDARVILPGKLAECLSDVREERELFLVEGDSAGGSAKQARNRQAQAVLPLRGKILNTDRIRAEDLLANKEIEALVESLGCGIGKKFNLDNLRYERVILLMDADSDGGHIVSLLLTFFYRHMPDLIKGGHVFIAQPPLFSVIVGKEKFWAMNNGERDSLVKKHQKKNPEVSRFKGLGEMRASDLKETTMDLDTRNLIPVEWASDEELCERVFTQLMGRKAEGRLEKIQEHLAATLLETDFSS